MTEETNDEDDFERESRLYALIHHVDHSIPSTPIDITVPTETNGIITPLPNGIRRYWKTSADYKSKNSIYHLNNKNKVNEKETSVKSEDKHNLKKENDTNLEFCQKPLSVEVFAIENTAVEVVHTLESSDEDEVVEVALAPEPTITIESSDEDDVDLIEAPEEIIDEKLNVSDEKTTKKKRKKNKDHSGSTSPVPSVVSSISDDFIRGDCVAFNITSNNDSRQFDFNLHGTDLANSSINNSLCKENKKKKNKKKDKTSTSTPKSNVQSKQPEIDSNFLTPKSRKQKKNKYKVTELSLPEADVYESDSNHSLISESNEANDKVNEPNIDTSLTNEASNTIENNKSKKQDQTKKLDNKKDSKKLDSKTASKKLKQSTKESELQTQKRLDNTRKTRKVSEVESLDVNISNEKTEEPESFIIEFKKPEQSELVKMKHIEAAPQPNKTKKDSESSDDCTIIIDETGTVNNKVESLSMKYSSRNPEEIILPDDILYKTSAKMIDLTNHEINDDEFTEDTIVMGNVIYTDFSIENSVSFEAVTKTGENTENVNPSTKTAYRPKILNENLDFDTLKGYSNKPTKTYSIEAFRADMERFYNESWGGENFNHREILKDMSRDKSLWMIDPRDRMPTPRTKPRCNICNQPGHRNDRCWRRQLICYMCGDIGHLEPRCPNKVCMNCGSPNYLYSTSCRACRSWSQIFCNVCKQYGHPTSACPDLWRRYHSTIEQTDELIQNNERKKHLECFCSGCARRGHLIHDCRITLPFNSAKIFSPYVFDYKSLFPKKHTNIDNYAQKRITNQNAYNQESLPTSRKNSVNLDKSFTSRDNNPNSSTRKRHSTSFLYEDFENKKRNISLSDVNSSVTMDSLSSVKESEIESSPVIQDSEVSDTSEIVSTARIFLEKDVFDELNTEEGKQWINLMSEKLNLQLTLELSPVTSIMAKGLSSAQDQFQLELVGRNNKNRGVQSDDADDKNSYAATNDIILPKKKSKALLFMNNAVKNLQNKSGDPKKLYADLKFLLEKREILLKEKHIKPKQLSNNRCRVNKVVKLLNMLLLGQAGLAEGSFHLNQLFNQLETLKKIRSSMVPDDLRKSMSEHFKIIFGDQIRDDYDKLLQKFYAAKPIKPKSPNKKKKLKNNKKKKVLSMMILYEKQLRESVRLNDTVKEHRSIYLKKLRKMLTISKRNPHAPRLFERQSKLLKQIENFLKNNIKKAIL